MAPAAPLVDRFVIGVDIETYSSRSIRLQGDLQRDLVDVLEQAAAAAGIGRHRWDRMPVGDGELAVLPPDVDLVAVVGRFVTELDDLLAVRNGDRADHARMRLRVAMHADALQKAELGYSGPALNVLARLIDAAPARDALASTAGAQLVLIVSEAVHRKVVSAGFPGIRPDRFRYVRVRLPGKGFDEPAYVHVPGHDLPPAGPGPAAGPQGSTPPGPAPAEGPGVARHVPGDYVHGDKVGVKHEVHGDQYHVTNPANSGTIRIGGRPDGDRAGR